MQERRTLGEQATVKKKGWRLCTDELWAIGESCPATQCQTLAIGEA